MAITGTEHPSSPQITLEQTNNKVYIRRFQYDRDYAFEGDMPALNSLDATYGYFRGYRASFPNPAYRLVELIYDSDGTGVNFAPGDGDTEYWAETRADEVPIEYHPSYLVKWNHNLYAKKKGAALLAVAAFNLAINGNAAPEDDWDTMKIPASAAPAEDFKVSRNDPGTEWIIVEGKSKPGLEFYVRPQRVVVCREYHRDQADAEAALAAVGVINAPAETFGESGGNWLVMSSDTEYDGKYWVTTSEYWYSDRQSETGIGWDTDIYATTTT